MTREGGSPTIRRRELGALLRALRADRGLTAEEVTERLLFSPTKLSRIETGHSGASQRDVRDLCELYGITEPAERARLMNLAREGKQRGWWQDFDLPYATFVGLEAEAASISVYHSATVPGLLQTEDYARAMLRGEAILDEAVLHRQVGGPAVMRAQLQRIIQSAHLPGVTLQVITSEAGAHPAMESVFSILEFETPLVSDIVYVEGLVGNIYMERAADLARYRLVFSRLSTIALNSADSIDLINKISASYT